MVYSFDFALTFECSSIADKRNDLRLDAYQALGLGLVPVAVDRAEGE